MCGACHWRSRLPARYHKYYPTLYYRYAMMLCTGAIPLKSPCQPFSLELSHPGVCTQALNLLGFVSPGRAVCQRRVITHRVSLAPLRKFTEEDANVLSLFADQAAISIVNIAFRARWERLVANSPNGIV